MKSFILIMSVFIVASFKAQAQKKTLNDYNINWTTPGMNSQGSMPIGNGDIGANVWVENNGDLVFYISKSDAWSEIGRILKLGKVRISMQPSPINTDTFLQQLNLQNGQININYGNAHIKFWVDANHPHIQVEVNSKKPIHLQVHYENWRKEKRQIKGPESSSAWGIGERQVSEDCIGDIFQEPDVIQANTDKIVAYHHNEYSIWKGNLEIQALGGFVDRLSDPLLNRTYGVQIQGKGLRNVQDTLLTSTDPSRQFIIDVMPLTTEENPVVWQEKMKQNINKIMEIPLSRRIREHKDWWRNFWDKSYIFITAKDTSVRREAEMVTQGYILQRYMNACAGRGNSPIKFNGSLFTVDTYNRKGENANMDADFRAWGGSYWWQNTRLPYWSMLVSGDANLMKPLFDMYMDALELRKYATKKYYQHEGAFFPETMNFWGVYADGDYGCDRTGLKDGYTKNPYIRYYWSSGLELSLMMLDYYAFTKDSQFATNTVLPFVSEILTFYDQHWKRAENGKILFDPSMSLETFHTAIDPLPEIVGIKKVAQKMIDLPLQFGSTDQRDSWKKLMNDLPAVPLRISGADTLLAPARLYSNKANVENPELYAIFPYRTYGLGKPHIELGQRSFYARAQKENRGWQTNSIQAAYLGLTKEVKRMVVESFSTWDTNFRFPGFWGPNYDWTPDQCHGSVAMIALQRMLMQYEDDHVDLLPAWPKEWDVNFKVSGPDNTIYMGNYIDNKLIKKIIKN